MFSLCQRQYTLFQNGSHSNILLFLSKLALVASFLRAKFKSIFRLERGKEGLFEYELKNIRMVAILE